MPLAGGSRGDKLRLDTSREGSCNEGQLVSVCACASDLLSLPAKEEEGDLAVYVYVLS